jgi:hypothetical protein
MKEAYLRALDEREKRHSASALTSPSRCDLFEYGVAVGVMAGIKMARDEFLGLLSAGEETERGR